MTGRVHLLDDHLINKIAAGEVVERPASVVKELVENAIDAEATRIEVVVEAGGRALVSVTDDGFGMSRDDALMALERHATSKIRNDADLFEIASLGFRGEAVPSIASVSRFELTSGERGEVAGTRIVVDGGAVERVEDAPNPGGTEIRVRRLFFNTPVRLKFLRTPRTEMAHVVDVVNRLALAWPERAFKLVADDKTLLDAPPASSLAARVATVLGKKIAAGLVPVQAERGQLRLEGLASAPSVHRANNGGLFLYVNGRFVKDRTLVGAVLSAYRGIVPRGRYPVVVLFLDLPPSSVDVNVHPTKSEVRFTDSSAVWRFVGSEISRVVATMMAGGERPDARPDISADPGPLAGVPALPFGRSIASRAMDRAFPDGEASGDPDPLGRAAEEPAPTSAPRACSGRAAAWMDRLAQQLDGGRAWGRRERPVFTDLEVLAQYDRTFLLCELGRELFVLDQHAAHERVLFERLRRGTAGRPARTQRLLVPELLELGRARATALAEEAGPLLAELGVEVSSFGEETVALQGVPAGVAAQRVRRAVLDLADELVAGAGRGGGVIHALRYEIAALLACHSSVRAGDRLSQDEIRELLRQLDRTEHAFACPHGRPTLVRFSRDEVARWFVRDS